jgi:ATP-dependent RNA helicase RhlE
MRNGHVRYDQLEVFVLDEADRMLDMGFINDVKKIISYLPAKRQTLLFSATMPNDIAKLANNILKDPIQVEVTPQSTTVEKISQTIMHVIKERKIFILEEVLKNQEIERALVFTRTKHGADKVVKHLQRVGVLSAAIHGNKSQNAREKALADFKNGIVRVLVATDIAARGIDVPKITHVINYNLPEEPESYVHRIGRTARAGRAGVAISFCAEDELKLLKQIERVIGKKIPVQ